MTDKLKVGIYGGTFSPPHLAHVKAAEAFFRTVNPDKLLIIPDYLPPHKEIDGLVTAEDRLEMSRLAFGHMERTEISDMEILRGGRSYTYETLEALASPEKELYLLCGTDMFLTLTEWRNPERIFELAVIAYVRRENDLEIGEKIKEMTKVYEDKYGARIIPVPIDAVELSSALVRSELKQANDTSALLPKKVQNYIDDRGLYRDNR